MNIKKLSLRCLLRCLSLVVFLPVMVWAQTATLPPQSAGGSTAVQVRPWNAAQATANANSSFLLSNEPLPNLGMLKVQLKEYAHCAGPAGCYAKDMEAQAARASALLDQAVAGTKKGEKLALVLDIDETALSNMENMEKMEYGYVADESHAWEMSGKAAVLPGTLKLYRHAQELGVTVFFITGRYNFERAGTEKNLVATGYTGWKDLAMRPVGQYPNIGAFKAAERAKIVAAGYRLVMNMGDQLSDLEGAPEAGISVKLPNPFYYIP